MKIGFTKDGLTLNSKKYDPLNFSIAGHGLESNVENNTPDPFDLLQNLAPAKNEEISKLDKINILQNIIKK